MLNYDIDDILTLVKELAKDAVTTKDRHVSVYFGPYGVTVNVVPAKDEEDSK